MNKAIIWGCTGQDGSHLADLLLEKNYKVVGVSRRCSTDNTQNIKHLLSNSNFSLVDGDITDPFSVMNIFTSNEDVDEVYNLAAQSHVSVSFKQPALTWDITGKGCLNILQTMVDLNVSARFYQASSSEMFGSSYNVDNNGVKYQDENTKFLPQSPYAIAKCAAHYMTRLFREAHYLHANCGILFNHEGERRGDKFVTRKITKWIGQYIKFCREHSLNPHKVSDSNITNDIHFVGKKASFQKLKLGNLEAYRDWGYSKDYCEAMWLMLQQEEPDDYVICTGKTHTIREFLDVAFNHAGFDDWSKFVIIDPDLYRPAEVDYLCGKNDKARNKLKWTPKHSFDDLVKLMVDYDTNEII